MNVLQVLTSNDIINVGFVAWFSAQLLKTIFTFISTKRIQLERLVGAGGMPSSHSSLTCSIAIALARKLGFDSPEFALSLAFAAIVMYDAMGVRRAAGEQAKVLNRMIFEIPDFPIFLKHGRQHRQEEKTDSTLVQTPGNEPSSTKPLLDKELKEFLGHTPFEVLGGCLLGILVAVFMPISL